MTGKRNPGPFEAAVARARTAHRAAKAIHMKPEPSRFKTFVGWWTMYYGGVTDPVPPSAAREIAHNAWNHALWSERPIVQAMLRCPGIDTTDQQTGKTFRNLLLEHTGGST